MQELIIKPDIFRYDRTEDFVREFKIGKGDLILTNQYIYESYFKKLNLECDAVFQENYGSGEPSDGMVETMRKDINKDYRRVIGVGGGTVLDIAKLFALETGASLTDLYNGKIQPVKKRKLILVPMTCGTGSEVTNISILAFHRLETKKGLASDALYADTAVLLPQLLGSLPKKVFAASSIDALIHAIESSLSPKANTTTRMFGYKAIEMILKGYQKIAEKGDGVRPLLSEQFLLASNYAGIAFGNAGCAAVHALSYPLGAAYHVAHGESNYALFSGVMKNYLEIKTDGEMQKLKQWISWILECRETEAFQKLDELLGHIMKRKPLHEYGMKEKEIELFTDSVLQNQQRLLANNFVELSRDRIMKIYKELF